MLSLSRKNKGFRKRSFWNSNKRFDWSGVFTLDDILKPLTTKNPGLKAQLSGSIAGSFPHMVSLMLNVISRSTVSRPEGITCHANCIFEIKRTAQIGPSARKTHPCDWATSGPVKISRGIRRVELGHSCPQTSLRLGRQVRAVQRESCGDRVTEGTCGIEIWDSRCKDSLTWASQREQQGQEEHGQLHGD